MANCARRKERIPTSGRQVIPANDSDASDPEEQPPQHANQDVLSDILDRLVEVQRLAQQQELRMLKYLVDMAVIEASTSLGQPKKKQRRNGS